MKDDLMDILPFTAVVLLLIVVFFWSAAVFSRDCRPRLIANVLECSATKCLVLLPDGTKGYAKPPVKPGDVVEVCQ